MKLLLSKSKNAVSLYVAKSIYLDKKRTTKIVEKLGTYDALKEKLNGEDPYEWAKAYIAELTRKEKEGKREIILKYSPNKVIEKDVQRLFNGGYLFLQKIYHELGLHKLCEEMSEKYKITYDLNSILSRLIYGRILFPSSKLNTFKLSTKFMDQPNFDLHHIYRGLEILAKESDLIQSTIYKNSLKISSRNTNVIYYDCTNYYFEIKEACGSKQYGLCKEHRPNPIVQMGLFMDGDGIPLAFNINPGNTNEQITLQPLEKKILADFNLSKFVVCTDAGLSSTSNRMFNNKGNRAFITTQSIKKLKAFLKDWALSPEGWNVSKSSNKYNLSDVCEKLEKELEKKSEEIDNDYVQKTLDTIYYKERWINEDGLEQKLIITYSMKYRNYKRKIRNSHIERAINKIEKNPSSINSKKQNDYKRFIKKTPITKEGEIANKTLYTIDTSIIAKEEMYDGFYAVCTNLESDASEIANINKRRWEIEECFRIMKSEFKARPVYLSNDDRIQAHFTTCFISLILYRLLEKRLDEKYTCNEIINGLKDMNFKKIKGEGYTPEYMRNDFTDDLHDAFGFRTDYEILNNKMIKKIFKETKK